jgi:hypothetical protein
MSYCRIGDDSDVYVLWGGCFEIHLLNAEASFTVDTRQEVLLVLEVLSKLGYKIPSRAIKRLKEELK